MTTNWYVYSEKRWQRAENVITYHNVYHLEVKMNLSHA